MEKFVLPNNNILTAEPPKPCYGSFWYNVVTNITKAYDRNGVWVTYEETDDPVLKELLGFFKRLEGGDVDESY